MIQNYSGMGIMSDTKPPVFHKKMDLINTHFPNSKKERPYRPALVGPYNQPLYCFKIIFPSFTSTKSTTLNFKVIRYYTRNIDYNKIQALVNQLSQCEHEMKRNFFEILINGV